MEKRHLATILAVAVLSILCLTPYALATETAKGYFGPSFEAAPTTPGGAAYVSVSTASGSSFVPPPSGSPACPSGQTCGYPLSGCTDPSNLFFALYNITVTDPNGNVFELGSSVSPGMFWPNIFGGPAPFSPDTLPLSDGAGTLGDGLNFTVGDTFVLPFGTGAGGFTFVTSLGSPPQTHAPEGPYYWWTMPGSTYGANKRLDLNPSISPTTTLGTYTVEMEGYYVCATGPVFSSSGVFGYFDAKNLFTEESSSIPTPEFPAPLAAVVVASFAAIVLLRKSRVAFRI